MTRNMGLWHIVLLLAGALPIAAGQVRIPLGPATAATVHVQSVKELREAGVIRQQHDFSCGAASIASIFTHHLHLPCTEREVIDFILTHIPARAQTTFKGFTLLDLKLFAESRGVQAAGYRLTCEQLYAAGMPVLVHIVVGPNSRHFVVFLGMRDDLVYLADPSLGRRVLPRPVFEQLWDLRFGMTFRRPDAPPALPSLLTILPTDALALPRTSVMAIALPNTFFQYHALKEF